MLAPFAIQLSLILVAPALFSASLYMTLGKMMQQLKAQRHSIIPVGWLTFIFVLGDAVSFSIQGSGAGVVAAGQGTIATGQNIIGGGISLQMLIFGLFMVTAVVFHIGLRNWPSGPSLLPRSTWKRTMKVLYIISTLVLTRSIYRLTESITGPEGYPWRNEWTLYVFDGTPMVCIMVIFAGWFPKAEAGVEDVELGSRGSDEGWQTMDAWPSYECPR